MPHHRLGAENKPDGRTAARAGAGGTRRRADGWGEDFRKGSRKGSGESPCQAIIIAPGPGVAPGGHLPRMIMPSTSSLVTSLVRAWPTTWPFFIT